MPVAAVPNYLGSDFRTASPGLRFGLYLSIWTSRQDQEREITKRASSRSREGRELQEYLNHHGMDQAIAVWTGKKVNPLPKLWEKNKAGSKEVWRSVCEISQDDILRMNSLYERHRSIVSGCVPPNAIFTIDGCSIGPFSTGLGNDHPLENGFAFLTPYGLPYLPGSGVKGVLRQAARELESGNWGNSQELDKNIIEALFGIEDSNDPQQGALRFWDVIPQIKGNRLAVEVMTAHQKHYYQEGDSPHESGQPIPINFLTIPPGTNFTFHIQCNLSLLERNAPQLAVDNQWKKLMQLVVEHAFDWLGFGAKTAVGYGVMAIDEARQRARLEEEGRRAVKENEEQQLSQATADLPRDAITPYKWKKDKNWMADNNIKLDELEAYLEKNDSPSPKALELLREIMELSWKGILSDPRATKGKKKKPKYSTRPIALAEMLNELNSDG